MNAVSEFSRANAAQEPRRWPVDPVKLADAVYPLIQQWAVTHPDGTPEDAVRDLGLPDTGRDTGGPQAADLEAQAAGNPGQEHADVHPVRRIQRPP
jgi:hypothetical protein